MRHHASGAAPRMRDLRELRNRELAAGGRHFLGQRQFEHAGLVSGVAGYFIEFHRQRKTAHFWTCVSLGTQRAFADNGKMGGDDSVSRGQCESRVLKVVSSGNDEPPLLWPFPQYDRTHGALRAGPGGPVSIG